MIRFYNVDKTYWRRAHHVLNEVSLTIHPRQFCFITGLSGRGKSTLLKLVIREARPTSGQILVNGRNLEALTSPPDAGLPAARGRCVPGLPAHSPPGRFTKTWLSC